MANILIVEDDPNLRDAYINILDIKGHYSKGVGSVVEAIESLGKTSPDMVFLDMKLVGESGYAVLSFIRHFSRFSNTKVVVVSGYCDLRNLALSGWGADFFLAKPFAVPDLDAILNNISVPAVRTNERVL
jgi:DNA-binding response OmpR family regulator